MLDISVVIPLFNEEENVKPLHDALYNILSGMMKKYEIIFIDDGSSDSTFQKLREISRQNPHVRVIKFRINCGQSAATDAGFELSSGEVVIVMDGDLQNDPKDIPAILKKIDEGFDVVSGWRKNRKDKLLFRKVPSVIANRLICSVTKVNLHDTGCALKAYRKEVVKKINLYGELHRFLPALAKVEGARISEIPVSHHERIFGESKYGISRTFRVLMDLLSLNLFMKYLQKPLWLFGKISFLFFFFSFITSGGLIYGLIYGKYGPPEQNILITVLFLFFSSGILFIFLGLLADLIFSTGKKRNLYLSKTIKN